MRLALTAAFALGALGAAPALAQQPAAPAAVAAPAAPVASVGATLNITPKRLTLDRNHRNGSIFLLNQGDAETTVDITLVDRVMLGDGQIVAVDDAVKSPDSKAVTDRLKSAHELVQISPRRVTLIPGRGQTIRLRLASLPEGPEEFRTHLTITTIPPRESGLTAESAAGGANTGLRFQITAVYGISIPVIVRTADADVRANVENPRLEFAEMSLDGRSAPKRTPVVVFDLVRAGPSSLYGNVEVRRVGEKKGAEALGIARGVGVYPEIDRRVVRIPLTRAPAAGEKLEVTFTDDDASPGKVLAKAVL
jgi:hypothetical protein